MAKKYYTELKNLIDENVSVNRVVWAEFLNQLFNHLIDSLQFKWIVDSTAERNEINSALRYEGMLVYVKGDSSLYILEADLTTWTKFNKVTYTQTQVNSLLNNKVDKITGWQLTERNFSLNLLNKLNSVEWGATKDHIKPIRISHQGITNVEITDHTLLIDALNGEKVVILPAAEDNEGLIICVKKIDNSINKVIIYPSDWDSSISASDSDSIAFQIIEFGYQYDLLNQGDVVQLQAKNNDWYKIN